MTIGTTATERFGEALRDERQRRSVTLEDISQTTKVTVRNLRALESEAFDQLPGGILGKGIVRGYVRYLGLNEDEWIERFLHASGQDQPAAPDDRSDWASFALNSASNRQTQMQNLRMRWAIVLMLLVVLAGIGWLVWGFVSQRMTAVSAAPAMHSTTSPEAPAATSTARHGKRAHPSRSRSLHESAHHGRVSAIK